MGVRLTIKRSCVSLQMRTLSRYQVIVDCNVVKCAHCILVLILTGWRRIVVGRLYYASITLACFLGISQNAGTLPELNVYRTAESVHH